MAKVFPFRPMCFSQSKVPLGDVVTQPYDKISPAMQDKYYDRHPHNLVRIILGKPLDGDGPEHNVYTRAANLLQEWQASGILQTAPVPGFFAYFQEFTVPGSGETRTRKGLVGLGQLEDYANRIVFPHERTLSGPKQDRLDLMRHTRTHFEQIFMLYADPQRRIDALLDRAAEGPPAMEVRDEYDVQHRVWSITEPGVIEAIQADMQPRPLIIADGHHRYEMSLLYRDELRAQGRTDPNGAHTRMMMSFFNIHSPGLTILATHRVLRDLPAFTAEHLLNAAAEYFEIRAIGSASDAMKSELAETPAGRIRILCVMRGAASPVSLDLRPELDLDRLLPDLSPKQRMLDVVILHRILLERCLGITEDAVRKQSHLTYFREMASAVDEVGVRGAQAAFLLNPTRIDQVVDIALECGVMPQKSTDFYPKVLSGLTMYALE